RARSSGRDPFGPLRGGGGTAVQQPPDAAVVLVAHHDRRRRFHRVVGAVVERANLAVIARGVVDADGGTVGDEKLVQHVVGLRRRQRPLLLLVRVGVLLILLRSLLQTGTAATRRRRGCQLVENVGILAP